MKDYRYDKHNNWEDDNMKDCRYVKHMNWENCKDEVKYHGHDDVKYHCHKEVKCHGHEEVKCHCHKEVKCHCHKEVKCRCHEEAKFHCYKVEKHERKHEDKCERKYDDKCDSCICDQLRHLQPGTTVNIIFSSGVVSGDLTFIYLDAKNCCAHFLDTTVAAPSRMTIDCKRIFGIRQA
ncbi:MAG: hypothetical protein RR595_11245 [Lysinibacillus sp.]